MDIHIDGLEVYGYHGVLPEEKTLGQQFRFDVRLRMDDCRGEITDKVADTIDYTEAIDVVTEVAGCRSYDLLEKLARSVAQALLDRFPVAAVWVRVTKPHPPIPCSLRGVGVSLELRRPAGGGAGTPAAAEACAEGAAGAGA
ncbi:MAG: dihydroneopterin aldolase [Thermoleophilia bacterium]